MKCKHNERSANRGITTNINARAHAASHLSVAVDIAQNSLLVNALHSVQSFQERSNQSSTLDPKREPWEGGSGREAIEVSPGLAFDALS